GYGTCQVLLQLGELIKTHSFVNPLFIYGLSEFHELRNVADPRQDFMIAISSPSRTSYYPVCQLDINGDLLVLPPRTYELHFPFISSSAFFRGLNDLWLQIWFEFLTDDPYLVTKRLIKDMAELVRRADGQLIILFQSMNEAQVAKYSEFLEEIDVKYVNGAFEKDKDELTLSDGHPNAALNERWARMILESLPK
ncbi:MAG: hypothetical protein KDD53_02160, partial [Bdellovibrionales bacterium]|nr:hypothetical protein [Bdellovibrionales bacterium]